MMMRGIAEWYVTFENMGLWKIHTRGLLHGNYLTRANGMKTRNGDVGDGTFCD